MSGEAYNKDENAHYTPTVGMSWTASPNLSDGNPLTGQTVQSTAAFPADAVFNPGGGFDVETFGQITTRQYVVDGVSSGIVGAVSFYGTMPREATGGTALYFIIGSRNTVAVYARLASSPGSYTKIVEHTGPLVSGVGTFTPDFDQSSSQVPGLHLIGTRDPATGSQARYFFQLTDALGSTDIASLGIDALEIITLITVYSKINVIGGVNPASVQISASLTEIATVEGEDPCIPPSESPTLTGDLLCCGETHSLAWTAIENAESYTLYRDGVSYATGITDLEYTATGQNGREVVTWRISAVNGCGEGPLSDPLTLGPYWADAEQCNTVYGSTEECETVYSDAGEPVTAWGDAGTCNGWNQSFD